MREEPVSFALAAARPMPGRHHIRWEQLCLDCWTSDCVCVCVCLSQIAMQALGFEPTKEELRTLEAELNVEGSGSIRFEDFLAIMSVKVVGLWGGGADLPPLPLSLGSRVGWTFSNQNRGGRAGEDSLILTSGASSGCPAHSQASSVLGPAPWHKPTN